MSNLETWSMNQVNKLDISDEKKDQYKSILDAFSEQGHSGFSAGYALSYIMAYTEEGYDVVKKKLDDMVNNTEHDDNGMQRAITNDIMQIIDLFDKYKFSKEEAGLITRLMDYKPIVHLTGADEEWDEASNWGPTDKVSQQNKLCSAVFRYNYDNKTAHYLYGRVYSENGGHTWFTGNHGDGIVKSSIPIEFPYWVPDKSEYVYLNGEDSSEIITDKNRIKELYDEWERSHKNEH